MTRPHIPPFPSMLRLLPLLLALAAAVQCTDDAGGGRDKDSILRLGSGFVVWESNRTGDWRIWTCRLDGSGTRQISPDEHERDHFCPHISPGGEAIAYLSYPKGLSGYGGEFNEGQYTEMRMMDPDGGGDRSVVRDARAADVGGHRAIVWIDDLNLVYCDPSGRALELNLATGRRTQRTAGGGYLINATRTAAFKKVVFPPYNPDSPRIAGQKSFKGCEPYVTHDGKWGFWMNGGGGPVNRIRLDTGEVSPIMERGDDRLPRERNQIYFPMVSRCGNLFAIGASSSGQHDHNKSDYDIFVAPMDPETLELTGRPARYTFDEGTDRYPDVHLERAGIKTAAVDSAPVVEIVGVPQPAVSPETWPTSREGLVFLFQTDEKRNEVRVATGETVAANFEKRGRARFDHDFAMVVDGGACLAPDADQLLAACRESNQLTIEVTINSTSATEPGPARIVSFSESSGSRNFTLGQNLDELVLRLRTPKTGPNGLNPEVSLGRIEAGRRHHLTVTYRPGTLIAYLDGKEVSRTDLVTGDFSNWSPQRLIFGDEYDGSCDWKGSLEGIALYSRALPPGEVADNARQYAALIAARPNVDSVRVKAELVEISRFPTLEEISPYREALVTARYEVKEVIEGQLDSLQLLVAHWALLDGEPQPIKTLKPGAEVTLWLEPLEANRQLKSTVRRDDFGEGDDLDAPRWFAIELNE